MTIPKNYRAAAPEALRDALEQIDALTRQIAAIATQLADCRTVIAEAASAIQRLNDIDPLTQLANRRRLFEFAEYELDRALSLDLPFALLMIDIDNFKLAVNDRFGHPTGDFCLRTTGRKCLSQVREELDLVARYGGEELCIVLPGLDETQAAAVGERIRRTISAYRRRCDGCRWTVTIGVADRAHATTVEGIIAAADRALYTGKHNGKNQVVTATSANMTDFLMLVAA